MFNKEDLVKAKAFVDLFKNSLHDRMLICPDDELIKTKHMIDGLIKFDNKLSIELKSNDSEYLKTLND